MASEYAARATIQDAHIDSINTVSFSLDGAYFATGGDDGNLCVFTQEGQQIRCYQAETAIQVVIWSDRKGFPHTMIAGDQRGDIHTINIGSTEDADRMYLEHVPGCVHALGCRGLWLIASAGSAVYLIKQGTPASWYSRVVLPRPAAFPELGLNQLSEPQATSVGFIGSDIAVVTYLEHGIVAYSVIASSILWQIRPRSCRIGASHISPNFSVVAATNLYDGIDWYTVQQTRQVSSSQWSHTTTSDIHQDKNVILPIKYIENGNAVLVGGARAGARIIKVSGETSQVLKHTGAGMIQALDYHFDGKTHRIVTASSETQSPVIQIWSRRDVHTNGIQLWQSFVRASELLLQHWVVIVSAVVFAGLSWWIAKQNIESFIVWLSSLKDGIFRGMKAIIEQPRSSPLDFDPDNGPFDPLDPDFGTADANALNAEGTSSATPGDTTPERWYGRAAETVDGIVQDAWRFVLFRKAIEVGAMINWPAIVWGLVEPLAMAPAGL